MQTAIRPTADSSQLRYLRAARHAGCPPDQLRRFRAGHYVARPRQLAFHEACRQCDAPGGPTEVGYGGARGPGKSHAALAQLALDDCQRQPGLKALLLRKIGKAARESFHDLRMRVLAHVPHTYTPTAGTALTFPNGSRIVIGHYQTESDIDDYTGLEYDVIVVEEATTLTERKYTDIRSCLRTSKPDWRPRCYSTTNPGGVGHVWYKARFVDPARRGEESKTRFIAGTYRDNPFLNPEYREYLEGLTGWQKRAWTDGDWDIAAGQYFTTWRRDVHVVAPFAIPEDWPVWGCLDYGFAHYTAVYLIARGEDGNLYVVAEHCARNWLVAQHAPAIWQLCQRVGLGPSRINRWLAGSDVFRKMGIGVARSVGGQPVAIGTSIADDYARYGIVLRAANTDRVTGATELLRRLGDVEVGIPPSLFVFSTCPQLIACIPSLQRDPHRPEDVLKVDVDEHGNGGDDPYDALRYGILDAARPAPASLVALL